MNQKFINVLLAIVVIILLAIMVWPNKEQETEISDIYPEWFEAAQVEFSYVAEDFGDGVPRRYLVAKDPTTDITYECKKWVRR